ncbi:DNA-binding protein [Fibrobacter sp. UWB2]|uniref:ORF6N domain-containing protein n=1 Tax=Fibrobacter sp. UWB2 TaxID=1964358 RepID=UPI000B5220DA|nr:ORF6N domain-containing protein [Fibrobacter sp. UWB2]OWV20688.1 DNA-binding protein [Fibrobacter sp. UWB2]
MSKQNVSTFTASKSAGKNDFSLIDENFLKSRIYTIRGLKVMLDSDLAEIYGYDKKVFNQQVKNNIEKFDDDFRFQLDRNELANLISLHPTSDLKSKFLTSSWGGLRKMPFAFTEQGIYMLMTVLKGEQAIAQSKALIRLFKQMKDYIVSENMQLLNVGNSLQISSYMVQNTREIAKIRGELAETRTDVFAMKSDLQKVMENFIDPSMFKHFLILNGQKLEADVAYAQIYGMAKKSVVIIDNYVDVKTLDLLRNVAKGIVITIFSDQYGRTRLTENMLADFRVARQDVVLEDPKTAGNIFHDRYILLDFGSKNEKIFHCGASSKDAGNKITSIVQLDDVSIYHAVFENLL